VPALAACRTWCDFWKNITPVPCLLIVSVIAGRCLRRRLRDVLQDLLEKDWKSISRLYILTRTTSLAQALQTISPLEDSID
jgi:hypothetical protein